MSEDFDKILNDKLDDASLNEIMPEFDKDAEWDNLSERLPGKKRRILPLVGWTHAAALVAGLLIGGLFFLSRDGEQVIVENEPTAEKQNIPDVNINAPVDTVYITKTEVVKKSTQNIKPVIRASNRSYPPMKTQPEIITPAPEEQKPVIVQYKDTTVTASQPVAIAQTQKTKEKITVVHILDIDNEDRQSALNNYDPSQKQRTTFVLQISPKRLPEGSTDKPTSLMNSILKN